MTCFVPLSRKIPMDQSWVLDDWNICCFDLCTDAEAF